MDTSDSVIVFDENGMCDHCHNFYENLQPNWHTDERGAAQLEKVLDEIRRHGKGRDHDCLIGLSGGVDSSYVAYMAAEKWGLRPLIMTVDAGWNLNVAVDNIERIVKGLNLDMVTEVVNWEEMKDLQTAYFKSQVPYQDTPQDHVIFASVYNYAVKHGFKHLVTGGNHSTECVREPIEWVYQNDIVQIKDIHRRFGKIPLKTFPLCGMFRYRLYYRYIKGLKVVRALDYIPYTKETAIKELSERFGWIPYQNKHFENVFTRFYEGYWLTTKFGYDKRRAHFSSLILTGQLKREDALDIIAHPPYDEKQAMEDMEYIAKKLDMTVDEFKDLMRGENKTYKDYKSQARMIELAVRVAQFVGMERRNFR
jgi:N-acetyl sugar amidotransferase